MDDLLRLFGEATHHHSVDKPKPSIVSGGGGTMPTESPMHNDNGDSNTKELDPMDLDVSTTRDSYSLVSAKSMSVNLAQVSVAIDVDRVVSYHVLMWLDCV